MGKGEKGKGVYVVDKKYFNNSVLDKSEKSGIIGNSENYIHPDKIYKFCLNPEGKHSKEFFNVGYTEKDGEKLQNDINSQFDISKAVDIRNGADKTSFSIFMKLGVTKQKRFRTVWEKADEDSPSRLITAHRED